MSVNKLNNRVKNEVKEIRMSQDGNQGGLAEITLGTFRV